MNETYVRVIDLENLPLGAASVVRLHGRAVALFRVGDDVYALENACPHRDGPLGEGSFDGRVVTCPRHGWQFDVATGECVDRPGRRATSIPVRLDGTGVLICLPAQQDRVPESSDGSEALVRFGAMGYVGRFQAPDLFQRGTRVVVQSSRGVELGEVLWNGAGGSEVVEHQPLSGKILRAFADSDAERELALRNGVKSAFQACCEILVSRQVPVELIEAEQLFDGETIVFYFLGDPPPVLADVTAELAGRFSPQVQFRPFGDRMQESCGSCGDGGEHGCGGCSDTGGCNRSHSNADSQHDHR